MVISLAARFFCTLTSFLYPAYASYKALSRPAADPLAAEQVERWLMYWAVVGSWCALENVLGWGFTWVPFYSLVKALVFLYLSLPQSEGSTFIYRAHLAPFFSEHEPEIDHFLASLRTRTGAALAGGVGWAWERAKEQLNVVLPQQPQQRLTGELYPHQQQQQQPAMHQPPSLQDPASGAAQQAYGFLARYASQYMPVALSALSAAASRATPTSAARAQQVPSTIPMPEPIPTPAPNNNTQQNPDLRSRTFSHAQAQLYNNQGVSSAANTRRSVSSPQHAVPVDRLSAHSSSSESLKSSGSGSGSGQRNWAEMSYETIGREEAAGAPGSSSRPPMESRRSGSWFGWGGGGQTPTREKAE